MSPADGADIDAQAQLIAELKAMLAEIRRPWLVKLMAAIR